MPPEALTLSCQSSSSQTGPALIGGLFFARMRRNRIATPPRNRWHDQRFPIHVATVTVTGLMDDCYLLSQGPYLVRDLPL
jgi:hypothetical protein